MRPVGSPKTPGSGKKKGHKAPQTIEKEAARERIRQRVFEALDPLLDAQISNAQGLKYLVTRNVKTGKFEKVTKERMEGLLEAGEAEQLETIEVWDKDPNVYAFADLMNRSAGKPVEAVEVDAKVKTVIGWEK